ncbi:MAG: PstS family phosphate ABC transporter substrate-binding protein [Candidatus Ratteibacteria bacterium]|nr:PstS family phosphate ABC transporter substrate-binding protein [Candidatus Ratteibacteria bacterium]
MKKILWCMLTIGLLFCPTIRNIQAAPKQEKELKGTITISGAWALYPMVVKWAEEFQKIHPKVKIDIGAGGAGKGIADALAQVVDLGMVSRDISPAEIEKGAWWIAVTKDAVVPTINGNNPILNDLLAKGVKKEVLSDMWVTGNIKTWGEVVGKDVPNSINVYTRSDACGAAQVWAEFFGKKQEDLLGVGVYGDPGLAEAVRKDTLGIGFNNINYAYDAHTKKPIEGIRVLPLDINGNGKIDTDEDFYKTSDEILNAIATDRYPSPPARNLNLVSKGKPENKLVIEFIRWALTDGQKYVPESGYINLTESKLKEELNKLK